MKHPKWLRLLFPGAPAGVTHAPRNGDGSRHRKVRLLLAIDSLTGGGAQRVMARLVHGMDPDKYEVRIALTLGPESVQELPDHVVVVDLATTVRRKRMPPMESIAARGAAALTYVLTGDRTEGLPPLWRELADFRMSAALLGRQVLEWQPDCVLTFLSNSNLLGLLARAWYGFSSPVICSDHSLLSVDLKHMRRPALRRFLTRHHYPHAARHIAVADEVGRDLVEQFGVDPNLVVTILNGVDVERLRALAAVPVFDETILGDPGELRIVSVGRLTKVKGYDILLQALALITHVPWRFLVIGEGEEEMALRDLAAALGIAHRVRFMGWQPNPYAWMVRADLFVLASRWEALPLVLLEALALELPIVATACPGGATNLLGGGRYGRLVPAEDVKALSGAITELMEGESLREQFRVVASRRASDYTDAAMIAGYESVLNRVIGEASVQCNRQ